MWSSIVAVVQSRSLTVMYPVYIEIDRFDPPTRFLTRELQF